MNGDVTLLSTVDLDFSGNVMSLTAYQFYSETDERAGQGRQDVRYRGFIKCRLNCAAEFRDCAHLLTRQVVRQRGCGF